MRFLEKIQFSFLTPQRRLKIGNRLAEGTDGYWWLNERPLFCTPLAWRQIRAHPEQQTLVSHGCRRCLEDTVSVLLENVLAHQILDNTRLLLFHVSSCWHTVPLPAGSAGWLWASSHHSFEKGQVDLSCCKTWNVRQHQHGSWLLWPTGCLTSSAGMATVTV